MTIQTRDVIFTFENSCNCSCLKWFKCCSSEIEDADPVYVTPKGEVRHFDYKARGGANANARRTLSNINALLRQLADDQQKLAAIQVAVQHQINLTLDPPDAHIVSASQVKRIEQIALPIIRSASPENAPPPTPKRGSLRRSPPMMDLRPEHSEAVVD